MSGGRGVWAALAVAILGVIVSGCTLKNSPDNMVNGKTEFVAKCGACHTLARAGTTGVVGPNLDEAWQQAEKDGFKRSTFDGIVHHQIHEPGRLQQVDPNTGKELPLMPADLVTGKTAYDVAAYVADVAAKPGKDTGRLAAIGASPAAASTSEKNGVLAIPADPSGALAYTYNSATATPGDVKIESVNKASIDHDISIEGNGITEHGAVVNNGGTSEVDVNLKPGTYTYFCSVPGHREGGMVGKLVVK